METKEEHSFAQNFDNFLHMESSRSLHLQNLATKITRFDNATDSNCFQNKTEPSCLRQNDLISTAFALVIAETNASNQVI